MKKLLALPEAAERTGCTMSALRNLIFRRQFPYLQVGARVFVFEDELEKFLELSQRVTAEEAAARRRAA